MEKASQKSTRLHVNVPESKSIVKVVEPSVGEGNPSRSWSHAASRATLLHPDPAFKWPIGFLLLPDFSQPVTWDHSEHASAFSVMLHQNPTQTILLLASSGFLSGVILRACKE